MKKKERAAGLTALGILTLPASALANPLMPLSVLSFFLVVPALLFAEGMIIAALAKPSQVYRVRFLIAWFIVTLGTWVPFSALIKDLFEHSLSPEGIVNLAIGEAAVTAVEAGAIWVMLRRPFYARQTIVPPSILRSLGYSAIANLFSFAGSLLSIFVLDRLFLRLRFIPFISFPK